MSWFHFPLADDLTKAIIGEPKKEMRSIILNSLFSDLEKIAITNALFRRVDDNRSENVKGEKEIRETCHKLAMELF